VSEAAEMLRQLGPVPEVAIVLGSGLGDFAERVSGATSIGYARIPHWPVSRIVGHAGQLVLGSVRGRRVAVHSGRVHFYEGHDLRTVTFGMRVMGLLGVPTIVLTNAAGGVNTSFEAGSLMVMEDHINLMGANPLMGENDDRFGPRFPDMTDVYSPKLRAAADEASAAVHVAVVHGVYAALHGPSYETPAEIRYLRGIGADAVGMSTVPEAIVARHMGMQVLGISCITNMAAGVLPRPLHHEEVMETARKVRPKFGALVEEIVGAL
jgi:purine-nucleoside phosphorylase